MSRNNEAEIRALDTYERLGLGLGGHFVFHSGRHSLQKIECDPLFLPENRDTLEVLGVDIAEMPPLGDIDCVVGCPDGGTRLAEASAAQLGLPCVLPTKSDVLRPRSQQSEKLRRVLRAYRRFMIADDVFTTGSSVHGMKHLLPEGAAIEVRTIYQRGPLLPQYASGIVAVRALLQMQVANYLPDDCPHPDCNIALTS